MGASESAEKKPQAASSLSTPAGSMVKLNVYSPTGATHGVYHSGVEAFGAEYVFGGGDTSFSGVTAQRPRVPPPGSGWTFYQAVDIGPLRMTRDEALRAMGDIRSEFPASSYDVVSRNCNHFSDAFCKRLCGQGIPNWVNRLAGIGGAIRSAVSGTPAAASRPPGKATDTGAGGLAAAGLVARSAPTDGDLSGEVDWASVGVLNAREPDPAGALRAPGGVSSDDGPELLLLVPFMAPVKLKSLRLEAPDVPRRPTRVRLIANQRDVDMTDAAGNVAATQEFDSLTWDESQPGRAVADIQLNFLKFQGLSHLAIYLAKAEDEEGEITVQGLRLAGKI